ncbi:MAG TPA: rod shape-determining protein RodA [Dehalococcoidia bacterium]|nr:rod shape-determining protein RodA [Dehalococcoidia bacterium]
MNLRNTPTREFDLLMLFAAAMLTVYGVLLIYSGSLTTYGSPGQALSHPVSRQVAFAIVGLVAMLVLSRFEYRLFGPLSLALYVASLAALVFVLAVGASAYGSRRWIEVAGTQIQPSEIAKVATVIMLAKYLSDNEERIKSARVFLSSLGLAAVPAALVLVEPDLGSSIVFLVIWLGMVLIAGARPLHLGALGALVLLLAPVALYAAAHGYQKERIDIWRDPGKDPLGTGFNILQAEISIGSGRLFGKGFTHGTQTQLRYLRTSSTDYIFSVGAEELGFVGAMVLFLLFILLLFRCLRVASHAEDSFGRLIAIGVMTFILFQVFVNIGVNIRLLPVTGVPLPFVSQGGSSLITLLASLGILQSILGHRRKRAKRI